MVALGDNKQPPVPAPAFVDVVTFEYHAEGENQKVVLNTTPTLLRIDKNDEGYSVIYNPQTDHYTGLEHRNYTWWEFSWPEVRSEVENSKRYEKRLQDLGNEGFNSDNPSPATNAEASTGAPTGSSAGVDGSGYVWKPTNEKKRISDLDCVKWTGETETGENVQAWCYAGPMPKVQSAIAVLRKVSEPMELVPIRTIVPDFVFGVYDALQKGGVTPVLITWGEENNKNNFRFVDARTRDGKLSLFTVPNLYTKTTLVTMDGMIDAQPAPGPRKSDALTNSWQGPARPKASTP